MLPLVRWVGQQGAVATCRQVGETAGTVGGVDPLTAGPRGPHKLKLKVAVPQADGDLSRLRQDCHTGPDNKNLLSKQLSGDSISVNGLP